MSLHSPKPPPAYTPPTALLCPRCRYSLLGLPYDTTTGIRCPECGLHIAPDHLVLPGLCFIRPFSWVIPLIIATVVHVVGVLNDLVCPAIGVSLLLLLFAAILRTFVHYLQHDFLATRTPLLRATLHLTPTGGTIHTYLRHHTFLWSDCRAIQITRHELTFKLSRFRSFNLTITPEQAKYTDRYLKLLAWGKSPTSAHLYDDPLN